jgi:hypothetical protein
MRAAFAFFLVACASSTEQATGHGSKPAAPRASVSASASATASSPPALGVLVEGECRAAERGDCFTSADGFRAIHPFPLARTYRAVAVLPNGEVWIVGDEGTILRIVRGEKGERKLSTISVPKTPTFADTVEEIDGSSYNPADWPGASIMKSDYDAISALGPNDVWIAIGGGNAAFWGGKAWHIEEMPSLGGAGDAFMRDERGRIWMSGALGAGLFSKEQRPMIYDTSGGDVDSSKGPKIPTSKRIRAIARQGDEVWAAGFDGALFVSKKGEAFVPVPVPDQERENFWGLWLDQESKTGFLLGNDVYRKTGDRFDDKLDLEDTAYDIWSAPGGRSVWAVGWWAHRLQGGAFVKVPIEGYRAGDDSVVSLGASRFEAVDGRDSADVWMAGAMGGIYHFDGTSLKELFPRETDEEIAGIEWTSDRSWVAATGDGKLLSGTLDTDEITAEPSPMKDIWTLRKLASGDLIMASCRDIQVKSASGWKALPEPPGCVKEIGGLRPDDLWAVGSKNLVDGFVWRFKRGAWARIHTGLEKELYDVAVASDGTAWIGGEGVLFRSSGDALKTIARHEYDDYRAIALKSADDVWIAGDSNEIGSAGVALHWNGKKLERHERLTGNFLDAIAFGSGGEIWAVGLGGVGARYDGSRFTPIATGTDQTLERLLVHSSGTVLAVGRGGTLLRRDPPKPK